MKPTFIISCPIDTYSGYGARSRDLVKAIIELNKYDVKILPQRWGNTPWGFIKEHEKDWGFLRKYFYQKPHLDERPDIWAQVTIPNEFQPIGKINIGFTAGIETTVCALNWIEGLNRMDVTFVPSEHSKTVFEQSIFEQKDSTNEKKIKIVKLLKPVEVLFEGVNLDVFKPLDSLKSSFNDISNINEDFAYLFVGGWLNGNIGEDRKNVGLMIKLFYESFKNKKNKPCLILKTSIISSSYIDKYQVIERIESIKKTFNSDELPNVYLLHGELTDDEMNQLYNHPKIKAMISITKGEGFGRPLLEFSLTGKPIVASGWSGQLDFLSSKYTTLIPGKLTNVDNTAANEWLLNESKWFSVDEKETIKYFNEIYNNYDDYLFFSEKQREYSLNTFSFDKMKNLLDEKIIKYFNKIPIELKYED
jgi:hypothetical protein